MKLIFFIVVLGIIPTVAFADDWSVDPSQVRLKHEAIKKYCGPDGAVVYSNSAVDRYELCGEVQVKAACDAEGRKFIGKDIPAGYLDCSIVPRIQMSGEFVERRKEVMAGLAPENTFNEQHAEKKLSSSTNEPVTQGYFKQLDSLLSGAKESQQDSEATMKSYYSQIAELERGLDGK